MRVRTGVLFSAVSILAVAVVTAGAYVLVPHLLSATARAAGGPLSADVAVERVRTGVVWTGVLAAAVVVLSAAWISRALVDPLEALRERVARLPEDAGPPPATPFVEIQNVSGAVARAGSDLRSRLASLVRERDELQALLDGVGEGILRLDAAGRIVTANPAATDLLRLPDHPVGIPYEAAVRSPQLRERLAESLRERAATASELSVDERNLFVAVEPLQASGAEDAGLVVSLVDLTELRRLEAVRRDFVANASHELKTPLTSIRGYAETLADDDVPPDVARRFAGTIRENAERLQRIVDDLLDLSRVESGNWFPELEPVDFGAAAEEAWRPFVERARARDVTFVVEPGAAVRVNADEHALQQILSNLFDNALRYTPPGGQIRVRSRPAPEAPRRTTEASPRKAPHRPGRRVALEVVDTGSGIPREAVGRIFERFFRVDPARSREEGGTGLGLSIVRHMVESMGGSVEAESELGKGTTIRFLLLASDDPSVGALE